MIDSELARVGERAGLLALGIATMVTIFLVGHFSHSPCSAVEHVIMALVIDNKLSKYFSAMGRKSAKARMKGVSAKRRSEIARIAAKSRWAKQRGQKKTKRGSGTR